MILLHPNFIIFMLIPLIFLAFFIITNKKNIHKIFDEDILQKLIIKRNFLGSVGRNILLFLSLTLFIVALSRPVLPKKDITLKTIPYNFTILLDISKSMMAQDIYPNRFEYAKNKIIEFLNKDYDAKISIYAFSDDLFMISPKTTDKNILKYLIKNFKIKKEYSNSTNLLNALKNIKEKNIIVFSDADIKNIKQINTLKKNIIFFQTSSDKPTPIMIDKKYLTDKDKNIVLSKPNPNLKTTKSLKNLLPNGDKTQIFSIKDKKELFYYPLWIAFFLLCILSCSLPKKLKIFTLTFILFLYPTHSNALFFDFLSIKKAFKSYKDKDFSKSSKEFQKIAEEKKSPQAYYDFGNSLYKQKNYKEAIKEYKKVIAKNKNLRYKLFYNMANSYFFLKNYKKAYQFYKFAKEIKNTKNVKYNINITKKFLSKKDLLQMQNYTIKLIQKQDIIKPIKQKSFMIRLTKTKRKDSVSW